MSAPSRHGVWVAYAAALWALIFAAFHLIWASGWYVGLNAQEARIAFARWWTLAYDLVVAAMCVVAVPVALALGMPWGKSLPRRWLGIIAWFGTSLLVLRSVASLIQAAYFVLTRQFSFAAMGIWEPWFYLGAVLFTLSTWRYWRASRDSAVQPG
jgi:hypothetical protein